LRFGPKVEPQAGSGIVAVMSGRRCFRKFATLADGGGLECRLPVLRVTATAHGPAVKWEDDDGQEESQTDVGSQARDDGGHGAAEGRIR